MSSEITHKEAVAALSDTELRDLKCSSDRMAVLHLVGHLGLLVLTGSMVFAGDTLWLTVPAIVLHGIALTFLFAPLHETIHETAFATRSLNIAVSILCGFVILLPPRYFRYFHFAHHRFTQDPDHDPELENPKPASWGQYLWVLTGYAYWRSQMAALLRSSLGRNLPDFVPPRGCAKVIREARAFLAGYAMLVGLSLATGSWLLMWIWVLPVLAGQPFLRAFLLAEHTGCPLVPDMLENSRTTFSNSVVRWLAWNMPHHTAHHALPTVPFHHLPRLTELLERRLKSTAKGYVDAHAQIVRPWSEHAAEDRPQ